MWLIDFILLILGYIYTFFLPGFLIIQSFYRELPKISKLPLILLLSILVSTYNVYFFSLILGYSRVTILISCLPFIFWLIYLWRKSLVSLDLFDKEHIGGYLLAFICFVLFFTALYPGIFTKNNNYFVMSGVNWQDTAMHQSIIETISQGNFPPQAPYFSGHSLTYYYFADFHSSILETLFGRFWPRVLVYDNPFFVMILCLAIYSLAFYVTKRRLASFFASVLAVFYGNLMFVRFFEDILSLNKINLVNITSLLVSKGYTLEFGKLLAVPPMVDYFLQNRPMMIGLPAIALVVLLLLCGFKERKEKYIFLSGLIGAMLLKFQLFAFGTSILLLLLFLILYCRQLRLRSIIRTALSFFLPIIVLVLFFNLISNDGQSAFSLFMENFSFRFLGQAKGLSWFLSFYLGNFGFLILLPVLATLGLIRRWKRPKKEYLLIVVCFLVLLILPNIVNFTIYGADMFKFFYFMIIPASILAGLLLLKMWQTRFLKLIVIFILVINSLTSVITLVANFLNKSPGYSVEEYQAGLWIRDHTPPKAIFISFPSVHSAIAEIGGRLRVLSYTVWPYSHGFDRGDDNVFTREEDVTRLFQQGEISPIVNKYHIDYIYLGNEERSNYPEADKYLLNSKFLRPVYRNKSITVYQRR